MAIYIARRLLFFVPTLALVSLVVFTLIQLAPGNAAQIMAPDSPESVQQELARSLGLDDPIYVQYVRWVKNFIAGDFGRSVFTGREVTKDLWYRLPTTIELACISLLFSTTIGTTVGVLSAMRPEGWLDQTLRAVTILGLSVPLFWVATLVVVIPSAEFGYHPPPYYMSLGQSWYENLRLLIPAGACLSLASIGRTGRMMRTTMLDVLHQDYVRTARAKGLRERVVLVRHAARNALIPVVTLWGLEVPYLLGGVVIIETIFSIPGMGSFVYESINKRDIIVAMTLDMFIATIVLMTNLVIDLLYGWLDPRIRFS